MHLVLSVGERGDVIQIPDRAKGLVGILRILSRDFREVEINLKLQKIS